MAQRRRDILLPLPPSEALKVPCNLLTCAERMLSTYLRSQRERTVSTVIGYLHGHCCWCYPNCPVLLSALLLLLRFRCCCCIVRVLLLSANPLRHRLRQQLPQAALRRLVLLHQLQPVTTASHAANTNPIVPIVIGICFANISSRTNGAILLLILIIVITESSPPSPPPPVCTILTLPWLLSA